MLNSHTKFNPPETIISDLYPPQQYDIDDYVSERQSILHGCTPEFIPAYNLL